ncbi:uncharacterized protein LOC132226873 [Myotis daubentonii]|uniref:uncharacterized protein LOC132226873 n=1 Tax=Myotis daubentonii TaxID=98922 RepID=UPI002872D7B2|nr:uncharacterized protein LOC132226873 [Myotis daubentonii]
MGPRQEGAELWPRAGPARRGPGLSRRKTSQGLQIAALSFFFFFFLTPPAWEEKKKAALPLEADAKRMQNFNHLLHRASPAAGPGLAWRHTGGTGLRPLSGTCCKTRPTHCPVQRQGRCRGVRTGAGCPGLHRAATRWAPRRCHGHLWRHLQACWTVWSFGVDRGAWASGWGPQRCAWGVLVPADLEPQPRWDPGPFSWPVLVFQKSCGKCFGGRWRLHTLCIQGRAYGISSWEREAIRSPEKRWMSPKYRSGGGPPWVRVQSSGRAGTGRSVQGGSVPRAHKCFHFNVSSSQKKKLTVIIMNT